MIKIRFFPKFFAFLSKALLFSLASLVLAAVIYVGKIAYADVVGIANPSAQTVVNSQNSNSLQSPTPLQSIKISQFFDRTVAGINEKFRTLFKPSCSNPSIGGSACYAADKVSVCAGLTPGEDALRRIGNDCMPEVPSAIQSANFDLPFCHDVNKPILSQNCRLAACNAIPNKIIRRPGINCLADCNSQPGVHIAESRFFFEGINCLPSCKTTQNPAPGQNCVLEFNGFVMPFCDDNFVGNKKSLSFNNPGLAKRRENCLDVNDLPICSSAAGEVNLVNCVNQCQVGGNPGKDCVAFTAQNGINPPKCHHYPFLPTSSYNNSCEKYPCNLLSQSELQKSNSRNSPDGIENYCQKTDGAGKLVMCNSFSTAQLSSVVMGRHCEKITCGCLVADDPNVAVDEYDLGPDLLAIRDIDLANQNNSYRTAFINSCKSTFSVSGGSLSGEINYIDDNRCCLLSDFCSLPKKVEQVYACNNGVPNSMCDAGSICDGGGNCKKTNINCREGNNRYFFTACQSQNIGNNSSDDPFVSWFFRPQPHGKSMNGGQQCKVANNAAGSSYVVSSSSSSASNVAATSSASASNLSSGNSCYRLKHMSGYPINGISSGSPNDNIYYTEGDMRANGFGRWDDNLERLGINSFYTDYASYDTRVPGFETGHNIHNAASFYSRVCNMTLYASNKPSEDFGYFKGEVKSNFSNSQEDYNLEVCLRNSHSAITASGSSPKSSCGRRECGIHIVPPFRGSNLEGNVCGFDVCKTVTVRGGEYYDTCNKNKYFIDVNDFVMRMAEFIPKVALTAAYSFVSTPGFNPVTMGDQVLSLFGEDPNNPEHCSAKFGDVGSGAETLRVRAYKPNPYDNYICAVLDINQISGVNHFDGDELFELEDGKFACVSGSLFINDKGEKICRNSRDTSGSNIANWHTVGIFKYIGDAKGYLHKNNSTGEEYQLTEPGIVAPYNFNQYKFFKKSDCIRHPLRVGTPKYNGVFDLTKQPELRMITPVLKILRPCKRKYSGRPTTCELLSSGEEATDFYEPMIEVGYGNNSTAEPIVENGVRNGDKIVHRLISVDFNSQYNSDPLGQDFINFKTELDGIKYESEVYLKKEDGGQPSVCLYRKVKDPDSLTGTEYLTPDELIGCVDRKKPDLENSSQIYETLKKLVISSTSGSYDKFSLSLKYLFFDSSDSNQLTIAQRKSADCSSIFGGKQVSCSNPYEISLAANIFSSNIKTEKENFSFRVERDECTKLNFECINRRKDLNLALKAGSMTAQDIEKDGEMNNCLSLMRSCNSRKGIEVEAFSPSEIIGFNQKAYGNFYGWFNEICVVNSVADILNQKVIAKIPVSKDGQINLRAMGKCEINYALAKPNADCSEGGRWPDCPCLTGNFDTVLQSGTILRNITPREAGLCVDINKPKSCSPIFYPKNSQNPQDSYFTDDSYLEQVDQEISMPVANHSFATISHSARSQSSVNDIQNSAISYPNGHAEFDIALPGEKDVIGNCKGFWKEMVNNGIAMRPKADCSNSGIWENFRNSCERFSCSAIVASQLGSDEDGFYPGYDMSNQEPQNRGLVHGFASWPSFQKTNDKFEEVAASSCIVGYKPVNANASVGNVFGGNVNIKNTYSSALQKRDKELLASVFRQNSGYQGQMPTRQCNQLGFWRQPLNSCERITCRATVNLPKNPTSNSCSAQNSLENGSFCVNDILTMWSQVGGVSVDKDGLASRTLISNTYLQDSMVEGSCVQEMGFYPLNSGAKPVLFCDQNGNWSKIFNNCTRNCEKVDAARSSQGNGDGYATWDAFSSVVGPVTYGFSSANMCLSGYIPNPYPPRKDTSGEDGIEDSNSCLATATHSVSVDGYSIYKYTLNQNNSVGCDQNLIKITIPAQGDNASSTSYLEKPDGSKYEIKRKSPNISSNSALSTIALRDPYVGELESGKTYIFQKVLIGGENYWMSGLAYNKDIEQDLRSANYSPVLPNRMCIYRSSAAGVASSWSGTDSQCVNSCPGAKDPINPGQIGYFDDRIGVGVTLHKISTSPQSLAKVRWDEQGRNSWQIQQLSKNIGAGGYVSPVSQNSPITVGNFNQNKGFILARKCGSNGKWEDPIVLCPADNTQEIDGAHAVINHQLSNGIPGNYLQLGVGSASAQCVNGYDFDFVRNSNGSISDKRISYDCSYKNGDQYIDQVYLKRAGDPCIKTCTSNENKVFDRVQKDPRSYASLPNKFREGEVLNLKCFSDQQNQYGHKYTGISRPVSASEDISQLCGEANSTQRLYEGPSVVCNASGNWSGVVNACDKCPIKCDDNSKIKEITIVGTFNGTGERNVTSSEYYSNLIGCSHSSSAAGCLDPSFGASSNNICKVNAWAGRTIAPARFYITVKQSEGQAKHADFFALAADKKEKVHIRLYVNPNMNSGETRSSILATDGRLIVEGASGVRNSDSAYGKAYLKCETDGKLTATIKCCRGTNGCNP